MIDGPAGKSFSIKIYGKLKGHSHKILCEIIALKG
jgi:hypothetical protein